MSLRLLRLVLTIIFVNNLIQFLKARAPLQGNVSVKKLLILGNVTGGVDLKPIFVVMTNHAGVCGSLFTGIVKWGAATSHAPDLGVSGQVTCYYYGKEKFCARQDTQRYAFLCYYLKHEMD